MRVRRGTCHVLFALDVGQSIDLTGCRRHLQTATQPAWVEHPRRAPDYFHVAPAPLRVRQRTEPLHVGTFSSSPDVDCILYDFGAVSVSYEFALDGPLATLLDLGCALGDVSGLAADARRRVEGVLAAAGESIRSPFLHPLMEDYVIFAVEETEPPLLPQELVARYGQEIARILRGERADLSEQETGEALAQRISFENNDVAIIDTDASFILDRDSDDARTVLEFANVQLLEMRYLDARLDRALDRSYDALAPRTRRIPFLPPLPGADLRKVAQMQVDAAILFERVSNAVKLLGDQYLARVYRLAAHRFHLAAWNEAILRKLDTVESIYQKLFDRASTRRMELIEWLVVILIAVSMILPFI